MDTFNMNSRVIVQLGSGFAALRVSDGSSESSKSSTVSTNMSTSTGESRKAVSEAMLESPKKKVRKPSKEHWSEKKFYNFVETFKKKDLPQGCKDAQLRHKHGAFHCYRDCGLYFKSKKEENAHYENGLSCRNYIHNRTDLELKTTPTPPLEEVTKLTPISMDLTKVFKVYEEKGINLPYTC